MSTLSSLVKQILKQSGGGKEVCHHGATVRCKSKPGPKKGSRKSPSASMKKRSSAVKARKAYLAKLADLSVTMSPAGSLKKVRKSPTHHQKLAAEAFMSALRSKSPASAARQHAARKAAKKVLKHSRK